MPRMKPVVALALVAALGITAAASANAGAKQASRAKVSMRTARATALAKIPGGRIQTAELEREHGRLVYSFDIRVPGKSGIEEVQVDAINGEVVSVVHESPKVERKESLQEKGAGKTRSDSKAKTAGHS